MNVCHAGADFWISEVSRMAPIRFVWAQRPQPCVADSSCNSFVNLSLPNDSCKLCILFFQPGKRFPMADGKHGKEISDTG